MRGLIVTTVWLSLLALVACKESDALKSAPAGSGITSEVTPVDTKSCEKKVDPGDPDEIPYLLCKGAGGYSLIVRSVESGRKSVDVVDEAGSIHPLAFQDTVTRAMSNLKGAAEWRVDERNGKQTPIALLIHVEAREDQDEPEKVTQTYIAVAKITPNGACVTDRIVDGTRTPEQLQEIADSAPDRACTPTLPPPPDKPSFP